MSANLNQAYELSLFVTQRDYVIFLIDKQSVKGLSWSNFYADNFAYFFYPSQREKLKTKFIEGFTIIFPFLKRDLFS